MSGEQTQGGPPQTSKHKLQQLCPITQKHVQQQWPWFIYLSERVQNSLYGYRLKCIMWSGNADESLFLQLCSTVAGPGDAWFGLWFEGQQGHLPNDAPTVDKTKQNTKSNELKCTYHHLTSYSITHGSYDICFLHLLFHSSWPQWAD